MKLARLAIAAAAAIPWLIGALASPGTDTTRAARDLVAALRPAQRTALVQPFEGEERTQLELLSRDAGRASRSKTSSLPSAPPSSRCCAPPSRRRG